MLQQSPEGIIDGYLVFFVSQILFLKEVRQMCSAEHSGVPVPL